MDCYKDEKKGVAHKVILAVVTEYLIVFADFLAHLNWCRMNRFVAHKCTSKPNSNPEPVAKELDQKGQIFDILNLSRERSIL